MEFWLGIHRTSWLATAGVPTMLSYATLATRRTLPRAAVRWWQDSGGFTQLAANGRYTVRAADYAEATRRHMAEIGLLAHVSPQDWMCEPAVVETTGLSVSEHQRRTTENYRELCALAPEVPWVPVLQGWAPNDYLRHAEQYHQAGIDLTAAAVVGLGSVCRRQHTDVLEDVLRRLHHTGIRLHGFGFKLQGIRRVGRYLASADSMAWSLDGRRLQRCICGSTTHKAGNNCLAYALSWREKVVAITERRDEARQLALGLEVA